MLCRPRYISLPCMISKRTDSRGIIDLVIVVQLLILRIISYRSEVNTAHHVNLHEYAFELIKF